MRPGSGLSRSSVRCTAGKPSRSPRSCQWILGPDACASPPVGPVGVPWSSGAAGVGPEVGPAPGPVAAAAMEEVEVPGPRSRRHQNSGSGCEAEAAEAEAGGRREGEGRGRSLLALRMDYPVEAGGARCRAELEPAGEMVRRWRAAMWW